MPDSSIVRILSAGLAFVLCSAAPARAEHLEFFQEDLHVGVARGLYDFDTATGVSTFKTTLSDTTSRFFAMDVRPADGQLFAVDLGVGGIGNLWRVDPATGVVDLVGQGHIDPNTGMAFRPSDSALFAVNQYGGFFRLDASTAQETVIGPGIPTDQGLAFSPDGILYGTDNAGDLFRVDPATGAFALIGSSGVAPRHGAGDMTFGADGTLYMNTFGGDILRVDPATGARSYVGSTGLGDGLLALYTPRTVPEPTSMALLSVGVAGLIGYVRRRPKAQSA